MTVLAFEHHLTLAQHQHAEARQRALRVVDKPAQLLRQIRRVLGHRHHARASTGGFYWEGAVRVSEQGRTIGRGYLELTGYASPLRL